LPVFNYDRNAMKLYDHVYGVSAGSGSLFPDQLVKLDLRTAQAKVWRKEHCYPGEPVFVQSPGSTGEDDGLILSVVLNSSTATSFLLILDARDFHEIAVAQVPHHIPFGFHGRFVGANGTKDA
jgi:beta,beta-carotene 9',10'-dioxygenase